MNALEVPAPIATAAEYRLALLNVRERMTTNHLEMLRLQAAAPEQTITAEQLAETLELAYPSTASNQYGTFAKWVATALGYTPDCTSSGTPRWWLALSYSRTEPERKDGTMEWTMRPELLESLRAMRWVV